MRALKNHYKNKKSFKNKQIMAEIITDQNGKMHEVASNGKASAGLATGIIGTSLAGLLTLGSGLWKGLFGGSNNQTQAGSMTAEDLYIERKECQDYIDLTKEYYEGRLENRKQLADAFFAAYQRDVDNSFSLYKNQRDMNDTLNQKITDASFGLYKQGRDDKDILNDKISALQSKVDVMAAIRPYQDALINCKIDKNAILADFNLARRTCRMIEGQLVLPNSPEVTGFSSYYPTVYTNE